MNSMEIYIYSCASGQLLVKCRYSLSYGFECSPIQFCSQKIQKFHSCLFKWNNHCLCSANVLLALKLSYIRTTPRAPWLIFELVLLVWLKVECMWVVMVPWTFSFGNTQTLWCWWQWRRWWVVWPGLSTPVSFSRGNSSTWRSARSKCISEGWNKQHP